MDLNPITTPNNILTDCINGTIITQDGNEYLLQNDFGNVKIDGAQLTPGYVPVGMKEKNGIIYIISYNPCNKKTEIGTFPSIQKIQNNETEYDSLIKISDIEGEVKYSELIKLYTSDIFRNEDTNQSITVYTDQYIKLNTPDIDIPNWLYLKYYLIDTNKINKQYIITDSTIKSKLDGNIGYEFNIVKINTPTINNFEYEVLSNPYNYYITVSETRTDLDSIAKIRLYFRISSQLSDPVFGNLTNNYQVKCTCSYNQTEQHLTINNFEKQSNSLISDTNYFDLEIPIDTTQDNISIPVTIRLEHLLKFESGTIIFDSENDCPVYTYNIELSKRPEGIYSFDVYQYYKENNNWKITFNIDNTSEKKYTYTYNIGYYSKENENLQFNSILKTKDDVKFNVDEGNIGTIILNKENIDPLFINNDKLLEENIFLLKVVFTEIIAEQPEEPEEPEEPIEPEVINIYKYFITSKYFFNKLDIQDYSTIYLNDWSVGTESNPGIIRDNYKLTFGESLEDISDVTYKKNLDSWKVTTIRSINSDKEIIDENGKITLNKEDNFYTGATVTGKLQVKSNIQIDNNADNISNIWNPDAFNWTENIDIIYNDDQIINVFDNHAQIPVTNECYIQMYSDNDNTISNNKYYSKKYLYDTYCGAKININGSILREGELGNNIYEPIKSNIGDPLKFKLYTKTYHPSNIPNVKTITKLLLDAQYYDKLTEEYKTKYNIETSQTYGNLYGGEYTTEDLTNGFNTKFISNGNIATNVSGDIAWTFRMILSILKNRKSSSILDIKKDRFVANDMSNFSVFTPINDYRPIGFELDYILVNAYSNNNIGNVGMLKVNNLFSFSSFEEADTLCRNLSSNIYVYDNNKYVESALGFRKFLSGDTFCKNDSSVLINAAKTNLNINISKLWGIDLSEINVNGNNLSNKESNNIYTQINKTYTTELEKINIDSDNINELNLSIQNSNLQQDFTKGYVVPKEQMLVLDKNTGEKANISINTDITNLNIYNNNSLKVSAINSNNYDNSVKPTVVVNVITSDGISHLRNIDLALCISDNVTVDDNFLNTEYIIIPKDFNTSWWELTSVINYEY